MQEPQQPPKIEDPNEYNQRRRLKEIADARARAREAIDILESGQKFGERTNPNDVANAAVQSLVLEIEWLVKEHGDDKYFTKELGPITIPAPEKDDFENQENTTVRGFIGNFNPQPKEIPIRGLFKTENTGIGFVEVPNRITQEWTVHARTRHQGPLKLTASKTAAIQSETIIQAFRLCTEFIGENDLDARLEDAKPHAKL